MTTFKNVSETDCNHFNENWEKDLWANIFSNDSDGFNARNFEPQTFEKETSQTLLKKNGSPSLQTHHVQMSTVYENVETSSLLSPTWEDSAIEIPQNYTSTSAYFSSFNPSSQSFESPMQQYPVITNTSYMKTHQKITGNKNLPTACINLVPTSNGNFKTIIKRKRKRTVFTTEQIEALEEMFSVKPYVTRDERQVLVDKLKVNDKSVKIWFQNRRLKNKKGDYQEDMQGDNCTIFDRINTVESKIIQKTDEYGYVTLDDKIMTDLVNVIDDYFTNNVSPRQEVDRSPIYEPISPASTSDCSCEENPTSCQHYENIDPIQELLDIESIIST